MKLLEDMFENVEGLKTRDGAMKRLDKCRAIIEGNDALCTVMRKQDGTYLPVVIVSEQNEWLILLAHDGICVVRA